MAWLIKEEKFKEVQRAYEMGQTFLDREDQRISSVIQALGR